MFSQACKYAIRAAFFVAHRSKEGQNVGIKDIAEGLNAPQHFIAKILQDLTKKNFLTSSKGPNGGFALSKEQKQTSLLDIVYAFDGDKIITSCCLGLKDCSEKNPCPIHEDYKLIRKKLSTMLSSTKVTDYNDELGLRMLFLKDK